MAENKLNRIQKAMLDADVQAEFQKIETVNAQLAETLKRIDYPSRQSILYGLAMRKLRIGEPVIINCQGDSMTYGHDVTSSDKRPAPTTTLPDGSKHTATRASITYPEALSSCLNEVYPNQVTVINRGYSGDGTERSYNRWITPSGADVTIIGLGVNDSRATWIDYAGNIEEYVEWYEKLIRRELDWGSAVIMLAPPKMRSATDVDVDTFANALYSLANKYGIPLIDSEPFLANYGADFFSDETHYNGKGYRVYGTRIASIFIGESANKPFYVSSGSRVLTRPTLDNVVLRNATFSSSSGAFTPPETVNGQGIYVTINDGGAIYYSFYSETEDTLIFPTVYSNCSSYEVGSEPILKVELDFGIEQGDYSIDYITGVPNSFTNRAPSVVEKKFTGEFHNYIRRALIENDELLKIHVVTKGWHTLKITLNKNSSTSYSLVHGIEFINYRDFEGVKKDILPISFPTDQVGVKQYVTHESYSSNPPSVTTTRIKASDLTKSLNLSSWGAYFYKGVAWKITLYNDSQNVIEYAFFQHDSGEGTAPTTGFKYFGELKRLDVSGTPSNFRTVSSISYDSTAREYVINWGGNTSQLSSLIVQPL